METLENDIMPSDQMWDELFSTPGYVTGNEHEFSHSYFKKYYTLAFMPSKRAELEKELQKASFYTPYLAHIVDIKRRKEYVLEGQRELEASNETYDISIKMSRK